MIQTYHITGMTCNGCKSSVENNLAAIDDVTSVVVNLESEEVQITTRHHIPMEEFQSSLGDKYHISNKQKKEVLASTSDSAVIQKSKFEQLRPLFLIFLYIGIASVLLNYQDGSISEAMTDFMGLFFIVFGFFKMLDLKGFARSFTMYDPLAKTLPMYGGIYPFIETALGIMLLMRFEVNIAFIATIIILGITTIGVTRTLLSKKNIQCACLGTALKLPMTEATFIENIVMIFMAVLMLIKTYAL